ncbi:unnamed protein product [Cylicocyclus nassatus]|uniref:Uncharacterized protein n=1 Tax=Cylicocyclus nassatus TaxID=53992 RepID=A0AA36M730_CYLNA|nr:unnamed protein product [Cylicocyclus nassatus]
MNFTTLALLLCVGRIHALSWRPWGRPSPIRPQCPSYGYGNRGPNVPRPQSPYGPSGQYTVPLPQNPYVQQSWYDATGHY